MRKLILPFSVILASSACYDPYAQGSKIVREVEAAGSGDLSTFSQSGLVLWFSKRPQMAVKIYAECRPIEKTAPANWPDTAEGSVCNAARLTQPRPAIVADPRAW